MRKFKEGEIVSVREVTGNFRDYRFVRDLGEDYTNRYLVTYTNQTPNTGNIMGFSHIRPKVTEVTLDEIAEKMGIPVEQLKIKK